MKDKVIPLIGLHVLLLLYSLGGICSKWAAASPFLSPKFILFYGIVLFDLFVYAICWQQVLKRLPLVTAYVNKSITVIWGLLWGKLFFGDIITWRNIVGAIIIIMGVTLVVIDEYKAGEAK